MDNDKTGLVAKRLGLNVETLRYYERIGLVQSPERTPGGHRSYSEDDINRLRFIKRARELEFSLSEIRELLALSSPAHFSCKKVQAITASRLKLIRNKLAVLHEAEKALSAALEKCPDSQPLQCSVLDELTQHAMRAPSCSEQGSQSQRLTLST